jgi:transposase-like protein
MALGEVKMSSKRYPEEFKIEAVRQVVEHAICEFSLQYALGATNWPVRASLNRPARRPDASVVGNYV